jgi:hypothetical protein
MIDPQKLAEAAEKEIAEQEAAAAASEAARLEAAKPPPKPQAFIKVRP